MIRADDFFPGDPDPRFSADCDKPSSQTLRRASVTGAACNEAAPVGHFRAVKYQNQRFISPAPKVICAETVYKRSNATTQNIY